MQPLLGEATDQLDPGLGEFPLPLCVTAEDVRYAVRAVVVHGPELWPAGPLCRSCRMPYRCRLHRWGRRILFMWGVPTRDIDALVAAGDPEVVVPRRWRRSADCEAGR